MNGPLIVARVEAYLDQILAPLTHRLSPFQWDELRRELREHLWARVEAYRELGQSEDEAITEALRQFGGAEDFLRQWRREWMKTSRVTWPEICQATRIALPLSLLALTLPCLLQMFADFQVDAYVTPRGQSWFYSQSGWFYSHYAAFQHLWLCLCLMFPIALGLNVGRHAGNSAVVGLFAALTADCLFGCLINVSGSYLWEQETGIRWITNLFTELAVIWMPVACTTAALTDWWTRRSKRRVIAA